jgi:hypothetical protein
MTSTTTTTTTNKNMKCWIKTENEIKMFDHEHKEYRYYTFTCTVCSTLYDNIKYSQYTHDNNECTSTCRNHIIRNSNCIASNLSERFITICKLCFKRLFTKLTSKVICLFVQCRSQYRLTVVENKIK